MVDNPSSPIIGMSLNSIPLPFLFLFFISLFAGLSIHISVAAPAYVYTLCPEMETLAPSSKYQTNLNSLLSFLVSNTTNENRFYNTTVGSGANKVFGILFCLIDGTIAACKECISLATKELSASCPGKKKSIVWYDQCMLRYSDVSFLGTMTATPMLSMWNRPNALDIWSITRNQTGFMQVLLDTLGDAAVRAANSRTGKKIATKEAKFLDSLTNLSSLYTLAECSPDISVSDCKMCLQISAANVSDLCNQKAGCTLMCPSCNLRYEVYPFYGDATTAFVIEGSSKQVTRGRTALIVGITVGVTIAMVLLFGIWIYRRKRISDKAAKEADGIESADSLKFSFSTIRKATNNFSMENKLGEGGFGEVYKGKLEFGQDVAIKRLARNSKQGLSEFKTEVLLVAKLQHRNLVKLLGFCLTVKEKLLVYEFLPNLSLNLFLSDPIKRASLNWKTRFNIVRGIARGLLYLHEDSRLKIVHRDLKSSNILLDEDMNPKIADFGMAKLFGVDQTQDNTSRIVGTFGYMAPEYLLAGHFSVKSDVYSFGVIVLEIVSGQRDKYTSQHRGEESLLHRAWRLWCEGAPLKLADSAVRDISTNELAKCIHIGMLCIQEDAAKRPRMTSIVAALNGEAMTLPSPAVPHFLNHSPDGTVDRGLDQYARRFSGMVDITELYPR